MLVSGNGGDGGFGEEGQVVVGMVTDSVSKALLKSGRGMTPRAMRTVHRTRTTKVHFVVTAKEDCGKTVRRLGSLSLNYSFVINSNTRMHGPGNRVLGDVKFACRIYGRITGMLRRCPVSMLCYTKPCRCHIKAPRRMRRDVIHRVRLFRLSRYESRVRRSRLCGQIGTDSEQVSSISRLRGRKVVVRGVFLFANSLRVLSGVGHELVRGPRLTITSSFCGGLRVAMGKTRGKPTVRRCVRSLNCAGSRIVMFNSDLGSCSVLSVSFNTAITVRGTSSRIGRISGCIAGSGRSLKITCAVRRLLGGRKGVGSSYRWLFGG